MAPVFAHTFSISQLLKQAIASFTDNNFRWNGNIKTAVKSIGKKPEVRLLEKLVVKVDSNSNWLRKLFQDSNAIGCGHLEKGRERNPGELKKPDANWLALGPKDPDLAEPIIAITNYIFFFVTFLFGSILFVLAAIQFGLIWFVLAISISLN